MTSKKPPAPQKILQFKVSLLGTKPPVWRRLLVPAEFTLGQLHEVLQVAMGWENYHLHDFRVGHTRYGVPDPDDIFVGGSPTLDEDDAVLSSVFRRIGAKAVYTYDFGDDWEHGIVLEKRLPVDPELTYPRCIAGKRACPPEDCGGVWGFYRMLEILADPSNEEHEELSEWAGEFEPDAFSIEQVNRMLAPQRRSQRRAD